MARAHGTGADARPVRRLRAGSGEAMEIPKDQILALLRERGQDDKASQAESELPDQVDTEKHGDLLSRLGIDPGELLGGLGGGLGSKLGL
jgi:hypothetical protein